MARTQIFGDILTKGIQRIRSCEANKPVSVIHDELGYAIGRDGGSAIAYWRQGFVPKSDDLENLAREIVKRSDLDLVWLKQFLASAEYPYPLGLCTELFPNHAEDAAIEELNRLLPRKSHRRLIGRDSLLTELITLLNDPYGCKSIAIDGMGGIGKTALVHEVATRCLKRKHFNSVVWLGSELENPAVIGRTDTEDTAFVRILGALASHLKIDAPWQLPQDNLQEEIHNRLCQNPTLIVLDNFEFLMCHQDIIIRRLEPIFGLSKAIMTSRIRFGGDVYVIHLEGLKGVGAEEFVRSEAKDRRLHHVERAKQAEIAEIVRVSGGSPLAMKLVVGQLGHLPINTVLTYLEEVKSISENRAFDEYVNLYRTIYLPTWNLLSHTSENLLLSMARLETGAGVKMRSIQNETSLSDSELTASIQELWRLSLLEVVEPKTSSLDELRYTLHALTQRFMQSDIIPERRCN